LDLGYQAALPFLAHEISENMKAHQLPIQSGTDRFEESHDFAITMENTIIEELGLAGYRRAEDAHNFGQNRVIAAYDYDGDYVAMAFKALNLRKVERVEKQRYANIHINPRFVSEDWTLPVDIKEKIDQQLIKTIAVSSPILKKLLVNVGYDVTQIYVDLEHQPEEDEPHFIDAHFPAITPSLRNALRDN
jgi:hypothetical protein